MKDIKFAWQLKLNGKSLSEIERQTGIKKAYLSFLFNNTKPEQFFKDFSDLKLRHELAKNCANNVYEFIAKRIGKFSADYNLLAKNTIDYISKLEKTISDLESSCKRLKLINYILIALLFTTGVAIWLLDLI